MVFLKSILAGIGGVILAIAVLLIAVMVVMVLTVHRSDLDSSGIGWDPISLRDFRVLAYLAIAFVVGFLLAWRKLQV